MKKKFIAMCMVAVTAMSLFAGCGKDGKKNEKFYIYSWNDEFQVRISKLYKDKYGEDEDFKKIEFVQTGSNDKHQEKIDPFWKDEKQEKYPDMTCLEADYIKKYTDDDNVLIPVSDLGIQDSDTADMYPYTVKVGTGTDGKLKALSWQACPGCIAYRSDLAEKYLGAKTPEEVQEHFKDWEAVKATAETIKSKSGGKCRLYSSYQELQRPYQNQRKNPWVKNETLTIDETLTKYMDEAKAYTEAGYCTANKDDKQFQPNWQASMGKDEIFCFTSCTWFNQFTLNDGAKANNPDSIGKWGICQGPSEFCWGGTWVAATKGCSDKNLAGKILKLLCDKDSMVNIYKGEPDAKKAWGGDFPNNKKAVEEIAANPDPNNNVTKLLGGQDQIKFFKDMAEKIELPELCAEDQTINKYFDDACEAYVTGAKSKEDALKAFKDQVKGQYKSLKID